jgi:uncharacterized protein (DUF2249 family)
MSRADTSVFSIRSIGKSATSAGSSIPDAVADTSGEPGDASRELPVQAARALDVRSLPPPLPMLRILDALRVLGSGETLLVHLARRPIHLYPKPDLLGCRHETIEIAPGKVDVRITKPGRSQP